MKEVLDKVRLEYRDDYEKFIHKMERETDEVRGGADLSRTEQTIAVAELHLCPHVRQDGEGGSC